MRAKAPAQSGAATVAPPSKPPAARPMIRIGSENDPYEHEAERVAEQTSSGVAIAKDAGPANRKVAGTSTRAVPAGDLVQALAGAGAPLAPALRSYFEPRFGRSFEQVRIHQGTEAQDTAKAVGARAFTVGDGIGFAAGEYRPDSSDGRRLIGHELAHVVQPKADATPILRRQLPAFRRQDQADWPQALEQAQQRGEAWEREVREEMARLEPTMLRVGDWRQRLRAAAERAVRERRAVANPAQAEDEGFVQLNRAAETGRYEELGRALPTTPVPQLLGVLAAWRPSDPEAARGVALRAEAELRTRLGDFLRSMTSERLAQFRAPARIAEWADPLVNAERARRGLPGLPSIASSAPLDPNQLVVRGDGSVVRQGDLAWIEAREAAQRGLSRVQDPFSAILSPIAGGAASLLGADAAQQEAARDLGALTGSAMMNLTGQEFMRPRAGVALPRRAGEHRTFSGGRSSPRYRQAREDYEGMLRSTPGREAALSYSLEPPAHVTVQGDPLQVTTSSSAMRPSLGLAARTPLTVVTLGHAHAQGAVPSVTDFVTLYRQWLRLNEWREARNARRRGAGLAPRYTERGPLASWIDVPLSGGGRGRTRFGLDASAAGGPWWVEVAAGPRTRGRRQYFSSLTEYDSHLQRELNAETTSLPSDLEGEWFGPQFERTSPGTPSSLARRPAQP